MSVAGGRIKITALLILAGGWPGLALACGGEDCLYDRCACTVGLSANETNTCNCGKICILHPTGPDNPGCKGSSPCGCRYNKSAMGGCVCGVHCGTAESQCVHTSKPEGEKTACNCGYEYCLCGKTCSEQHNICQAADQCRWQGKEPWLAVNRLNPIPEEFFSNYQRGLSSLAGQNLPQAVSWLGKAVDPRYIDCYAARLSDLAYKDFFPRRELGIAFYRAGNYRKAIQLLEASLEAEETAKAQHYLNLARLKFLEETQSDQNVPEIMLKFPVGINSDPFTATIMGTVTDDQFVAKIAINGENVPLWLSSKTVELNETIPLTKGLNEFTVSVTDLTGKTSHKNFSVYSDADGPLISINYQVLEETFIGKKILITGSVSDDLEVQEILIQGNPLSLPQGEEVNINQTITLSVIKNSITIQAKDILGNTTSGEVSLDEAKTVLNTAQWVDSGQVAYDVDLYKSGSNFPPVIELKDLADQQTFFVDSIYIEGQVKSGADIVSLSLNNESFVSKRGRFVFFNRVLKLKEGENKIIVKATDSGGNSSRKEIKVYRKIPRVKTIGSRMCISIPPFRQKGLESSLQDVIYDKLIAAFINQQRFNLVERARLEEILLEQKLSRTELVKQSAVMKLGRIVAADAVMIGTVYESEQSIEIYARLIDTDTGVIIEAKDVWSEDKSQEKINLLTEGLALKFKSSFPLVEGLIVNRSRDNVMQDLGVQMGMKPYRKLLVYREDEPVVHPVTRQNLGSDSEELGEVMVKKVFSNISRGDILRENADKKIEAKDKVIAK
ncbi:MAG: hypothetical protein HZA78_01665 [Candidatus Schekmanbacteria bacterium]|nr:hypothetical protein [Candidatus Schekmanbacteria bacterium]